MWEMLFDWGEMAQKGTDVVTYFVMAMIGTSLFVIRLVLAMFAGDAAEFDVDGDVDGHGGTDASFTLFSLLSVMAFIMGAGWTGLASRVDWGMSRGPSAITAIGVGAAMMLAASGLMYGLRKLSTDPHYDTSTAVGRTAKVYMRIPAKGDGRGKVQVDVSGRLKTMAAVSEGDEIAAFVDVEVVSVRDDETLVVKPRS
jgi:hypothetical protein